MQDKLEQDGITSAADPAAGGWLERVVRARSAQLALFWFSFLEATALPIPVETVMVPYMQMRRDLIGRIALIALAGFMCSALLGYLVGAVLFEVAGAPLIEWMGWSGHFESVQARLADDGFIAMLLVGLAPLPTQAVMIGAGIWLGIEFGMTAEEARADWNGNPLELAGDPGDGSACHHLGPAGQATPAQLAFMFENDLFVRYSAESSEITAPGGGRVGMDEAALQGLYGDRLAVAPHKYVKGGKMLMSAEDGGNLPSRLFFELDADGRVTSWRVGLAPQIGYVEGCR